MNAVRSTLCGLGLLIASQAAIALPTNIYFDNNTDMQLDAYTGGQPGASIAKDSINFAVPFIGVLARCNMSGVPNACPIDFLDHETGDKIASVILDVWKASIVGTPTLYGDYATKYSISGWETTPVEHISINTISY
jgi:hypothetical protein